MAELNFIFDATSPTFRPVVSSAAKAQGSDANVDAKATTTQLDAALDYARRGWAVLPVGLDKRPLTMHGLPDASIANGCIAYRIPDAASNAGTSRSEIYKAIKAKKLTARKIGRRTIIEHAELARFISSLPEMAPSADTTATIQHHR